MRKKTRNEGENEEMAEDYMIELIEAKMEQAEIRFKFSEHWIFETTESNVHEEARAL